MALKYTEEKLNSLDKETLTQMFLSRQEQLEKIDLVVIFVTQGFVFLDEDTITFSVCRN